MYDIRSNRRIHQILGRFENDDEITRVWPTVRMSYGAYKGLYPNGLVYFNPVPRFRENPVLYVWDNLTRWLMFTSINVQHDDPETPAFPALSLEDDRLP